MRVVIKLLITVIVLHGVFRVGTAYWRAYQFEDALQEIAQFGERQSDKALCNQALESATSFEIPITAEAITIRRGGNPWYNCQSGFQRAAAGGALDTAAAKIFIEAAYTDALQVLPGYSYPWEFKQSVMAWIRP
jgi:hypothetical protein